MSRPSADKSEGESDAIFAASIDDGPTSRALLDALDVGVVVQGHDLRILYANAKATQLLGITPAEITGRTTDDARWDVVDRDGRPVRDESHPGVHAARTGEPVTDVLLGVRREQGTERIWIMVSAVPQRASDGTVARVVVTFSDVSTAQRSLRANEANYFAVFRAMSEGLVIYNPDGTVRAANGAAERLLGIRADEIIGHHIAASADTWVLKLATGAPASLEHLPVEITRRSRVPSRSLLGVQRPAGDFVWLDVQATPMREGGDEEMTGILVTFADVTSERLASQALEANRARLEQVLDAVPGIVYQYVHRPDRAGTITFAAGRIHEMTGLETELVRAQPQFLFSLIDEQVIDQVWGAIDTAVAALAAFERVLPFRTTGGEQRWARVYGVPQETPNGLLYTGVILDATREQFMADALQRSQRREAMGDMAGGIAHNFNNMLAVILPNVQLARAQVTGEAAALLADAERAAASAGDLVKRMLALGRAESRDVQVDLVPIVREALHICRQTFDRRITIHEEITASTAHVRGNASTMQQVVLNFLLNARDALTGAAAPNLTVRLSTVAVQRVVLTIADSGAGMSEATLRRIGEPFFTTKEPGYGTGLGLASAFHSIAEAGGTWRVASTPGQGTTFKIELPLVAAASPREGEPAPASSDRLQGTVLIIDDEPMVRTVLARQLRHAGMDPVTVDGAEAALAMLRDGHLARPSLMLLDLSMPGLSGDRALPLLREAAPGVPVIALSGHVPESMELPGVAAILQKPMGQRELVEAVRRALSP